MIARLATPFTLRDTLDRLGLASMRQGFCRDGGIRLNLWQRIFAALGDWSPVTVIPWRSEILLRDRSERFRRFCLNCGEETSHEGSDELGAGWYSQTGLCRQCGRAGMTIWPSWWW